MATKKAPTILRASEGMRLTNGIAYGKVIYLGVNDKAENWREITDEEYNAIKAEVDEPAL